jgi:uncharacterized protein
MAGSKEIETLQRVLEPLWERGRVLLAILYGSYARGTSHVRSDIDLALYLNAQNADDEIAIIDRVLMAVEADVSILRLDDEDESPFVVQEALKGIHLVEPDVEILYSVSHRVLHECESIRFRRELNGGQG